MHVNQNLSVNREFKWVQMLKDMSANMHFKIHIYHFLLMISWTSPCSVRGLSGKPCQAPLSNPNVSMNLEHRDEVVRQDESTDGSPYFHSGLDLGYTS